MQLCVGRGMGPCVDLFTLTHRLPLSLASSSARTSGLGVLSHQWEIRERHLPRDLVPAFGRPSVVAEQSSWCWISPGISPTPLGSPFPTVSTLLPSSPFEDIF